jgi:hypothetical protein
MRRAMEVLVLESPWEDDNYKNDLYVIGELAGGTLCPYSIKF